MCTVLAFTEVTSSLIYTSILFSNKTRAASSSRSIKFFISIDLNWDRLENSRRVWPETAVMAAFMVCRFGRSYDDAIANKASSVIWLLSEISNFFKLFLWSH